MDQQEQHLGETAPIILIVDDNPDDRALAARLLRTAFPACEIDESITDEQSLWAGLGRGRFDVVVTDYKLQWSDGLQVLAAVKARYPDRPVIMYTGTGSEEVAAEGFRNGLDDYVFKHHSPARLVVAVKAALARVAQREARRREEEELRRAKDEAEQANRLKDEFLATLSHELRTPLSAILGWAKLLRSGRVKDEEIAEGLEAIERNAAAQARLIEDLLDISRIVSGRMRLDVQAVALAPVVEAALETVRAAAIARQITVTPVLDPGVGLVAGDPQRLQQVVWNLLSNAVKFTPEGGRVQVTLERVASRAQIRVSDTGEGIPGDFLPHVFDRFRQASGTANRRHGGMGLGLSIAKHLVEAHGGTIAASSDGAGTGAVFTVDLPLMAVQALRASPASLTPPAELAAATGFDCPPQRLDGVRVLVVDDEADARRLLSHVLATCGATVEAAGSVAEALRKRATFDPHVLVSDIGMPDEDGYTLIRRVRQAEADGGASRPLPAVALTAFARAEDRRRAILAGFQVHVPKPVDPTELVAVVANLSGQAGA